VKIEKLEGGYAICADSTQVETMRQVHQFTGDVPLIVADPPYGNILPALWDRFSDDEERFTQWMLDWTLTWSQTLHPNAAFYVWGGIGVPGFRPFFRYLSKVEHDTDLKIANLITWKKKRAYGIQHNYLFTREECVYLFKGDNIKKPRCFNVPLLEERRGYAGYNAKYPAKSEFYRRTNVWTDVTEVLRGKVHSAQKAQRVIEVPIEVHTRVGEWVVDPFAGSGTTALAARRLGRNFVVIEKDKHLFAEMVDRLRVVEPPVVVELSHEAPVTDNESIDPTISFGDETDHRPDDT
jgi:site-specific DNA-methyltransferase (adenine-specific)